MVFSTVGTANEKNGVYLRRFSSVETRSPTTPNGSEQHQIYTVLDCDDNVFADEKEVPKSDTLPTPGTAPYLSASKVWSKKKVGTTGKLLIALGIFVILALFVGVTLAFIYVFNGLSSSSSSSSQVTSTTEPGTTSISSQVTIVSQETTPLTMTTVLSQEIHYDGHLNLSSPWKAPLVELKDLFQHDMGTIIAASPLYKYFIKSSLYSLRADEEVIFTLDFKSGLAELVEEVEENSLARRVQNILRKQVVNNLGIKLPIMADSIVILDNIPVTSATNATTMSVSSTTETETKGPCQALTFEPCHSLLESSTFYLPNVLHHHRALEAEDAYRELSGSPVNTSCSDFSIFYLCALLFPSCDNNNVPLHPCDTLCEVVKNDCGVLDGWPQNCNDFPSSNCRVAEFQHTTKSATMLPTTATASTVTLPTVISATTESMKTTTSEPTKTSIQTEFQCVPFNFSLCNDFGLNETVLPSVVFQCYDIQCLIENFNHSVEQSIENGCTNDLTFFCAYTFRGCNKDNMLDAIGPCFETCIDAVDHCGKFMPNRPECSDFKLSHKPCISSQPPSSVSPPTSLTTSVTSTTSVATTSVTTTSVTTTSVTSTTSVTLPPYECFNQTYSYCASEGFTKTASNNLEDNIAYFEKWALPTIESGCSDIAKFFYCGMVFPQCDENIDMRLPCKKYCEELSPQCPNAKFHVECSSLEDEDCARPLPTISTASPTTTSALTTEDMPYQCFEQTYTYCVSEGFTKVHTEILDTDIKDFETFALPVIQSGCSDVARFFYCGIFFPQCEENKFSILPCRKYCEEVASKCRTLFTFDCATLNEDNSCSKPMFITSTPASTTTSTASTTTTTTPIPHCEPLKSSLCSHFGYSQTSFPNLWGDKSAEEANNTYYSVAERSIAAGCSLNVLFYVCSVLFPACEGDGVLKLPCTSYCTEVNSSCPLLFQQNCNEISDPRIDRCLAPPTKIACKTSEFACININKCVPLRAVCNKANDCGDWSDERNCECNPEFEIKCAMGLCIPSYYRCDDKAQCPDSSDEVNCECKNNQYKCDGGPCIMPEWLCDGQRDCPNDDDEAFCHNCSTDEFTCIDFTCIPAAEECDGIPQCPDHTDEMNCIFQSEPVFQSEPNSFFIKSNGYAEEICTNGFTDAHGETACLKMGGISLKRWKSVEGHISDGTGFFQLDPNGDHMTVIGKGKSVERCEGDVVAIECNPKECGHRAKILPSLIINGENAPPGFWPWLVSVRKFNVHQCGGAIVHPYFILTAAHCIESSIAYMTIVAGSLRLSKLGSTSQTRGVRRVMIYPGYRQMEGNDIALLELDEPLKYTDFVKPLCFPEKDDVFTRGNLCYIAGWGHTKGFEGTTSEIQQETKLSLWDTAKCNSSYMWNGRLQKSEMCAGYFNGLVAACSGDSGSPVVCEDVTKTWKAVGVASYVYKNCSVPTKPLVFIAVSPYVSWIKNHTVCQFTCDDGTCLFDKGMLCDTVANCRDRSDEIRLCDIRANCSFTDKFLCGYNTTWQLARNGGTNSNRFPLFDHTLGNCQGLFLLGRNRENDLRPPQVHINTSHCMRFHFHMRGKVNHGMSVTAFNLETRKYTNVWNIDKTTGPDRWLMGMYDLNPGHYNIVYRSYEARFAIDDMWLIEGKCDQIGCFSDEFMCLTSKMKNCIPAASRCNIIVDCDNREDEINCAVPPVYTCNFENGNICALEQQTDDTTISEWIMVNSSNTPNNLPDHTFGNASGTLLKVITVAMIKRDQVFMSQKLQLGNREHCLKFFYASTSPVTLQVTLQLETNLQRLIMITNRTTQGWTATQATLPAVDQKNIATLTYAVIGGDLGHWVEEQAFMLDDITITPGSCQPFTCPTGSLLCEDEAYCVSKEKICDRITDCIRGTDEFRCECSKSEFKCHNGPCIPKEQTCNLISDCPDGSDEGTICDGKKSVSCDFEDVFMCGYKVNTSQSVFHWERAKGKTGDTSTGPSSGNSNLDGFYVVAEGKLPSNYSSLESIPFVSSGHGLAFYYHAWYFLSGLVTGRLSLIVTFMNNGTQRELWFDEPDDKEQWKHMCLDLPLGNISVSFIVMRGTIYRADIALDDVMLLDTTCSTYLMENADGRIVGPVSTTEPRSDPGCSATQKACRSEMCLSANLFCDGFRDCPDGSDEFDC